MSLAYEDEGSMPGPQWATPYPYERGDVQHVFLEGNQPRKRITIQCLP